MQREFVLLPQFDKQWTQLGFTDRELRLLQEELTLDPEKGAVIRGTGGLRKIRVALPNRGKSGSARVCYVDFVRFEKIYLVTVYAKGQKDDLNREEQTKIGEAIRRLEKCLREEE